ncbi:carbohydrate ABC transporter permease [Arthrobacter sp. Y81]|uniref:carbohydrate ABC transporter permease n=1 Tax=Arthrobacter sp. Y81 TaxID=2058897 RepID=UPI001CA51E85|nr:ABC transporter permease subunit [Arthrobacter sp. Y81]
MSDGFLKRGSPLLRSTSDPRIAYLMAASAAWGSPASTVLNSLHGLILADTAFALPVVALILKGAIDGVPRELDEAARVDGSRPPTVLARIILPLIAPAIAAAAVIAFFSAWNEYVFAVTFVFDKSLQPASVGVAGFIGEQDTSIQTIMAVGLLFTLPAVAFYLFAQRYVVSGMTAGAVKG